MLVRKIIPHSRWLLLASLLQACGGEAPVDVYEQLERPPQIAITPSTEAPHIDDENIVRNGLGNNIKMLGKKNAPLLKLNLDFDNAWLIVDKALRFKKITITDHDREQGYYLVNFDTDTYKPDTGFLEGLGSQLFSENFGLRKYQLSLKQIGKFTIIVTKDLGAITKEADPEENEDEVVDPKIKAPEDSQMRLISTLYTTLRDGFVEPEVKSKNGFFE